MMCYVRFEQVYPDHREWKTTLVKVVFERRDGSCDYEYRQRTGNESYVTTRRNPTIGDLARASSSSSARDAAEYAKRHEEAMIGGYAPFVSREAKRAAIAKLRAEVVARFYREGCPQRYTDHLLYLSRHLTSCGI